MGNYIYKYVLNDEIIYIGKTKNLDSRIYQHSMEEKFKPHLKESVIFYFECANSVEMDLIERALINQYKPELNVKDNKEGFSALLSIEELKWEKYEEKPIKFKLPKVSKKVETKEEKQRWLVEQALDRIKSENADAIKEWQYIKDCIKNGQKIFPCMVKNLYLSINVKGVIHGGIVPQIRITSKDLKNWQYEIEEDFFNSEQNKLFETLLYAIDNKNADDIIRFWVHG